MEKKKGLVSIVVSVHNLESRLSKCIESISSQSYRNLEIILIDDGSTDGSGYLCDVFAASDPRVRVIHQENQGLWAVRNRGVEESKGEYVIFPDGEDYFHKDYIRLLFDAINDGGREYPVAICDYRSIRDYSGDVSSDSEPVFEEVDRSFLLEKIVKYPSCGSTFWGANWNKLYRKSSLPRPFQKEYYRCQDFDSNLRYFFHVDRAVCVHKVLYYWLQWPGQSTRTSEFIQIRDESRTRIFYEHYMNLPAQLSSYGPDLLANMYRRLVVWAEDSRMCGQYEDVRGKVWKYERRTLPYFLTTPRLSARYKVRCLLSLHAPSLLKQLGGSIPLEMA